MSLFPIDTLKCPDCHSQLVSTATNYPPRKISANTRAKFPGRFPEEERTNLRCPECHRLYSRDLITDILTSATIKRLAPCSTPLDRSEVLEIG